VILARMAPSVIAACLLQVACGAGDDPGTVDGALDAAVGDSSMPDAGPRDAGRDAPPRDAAQDARVALGPPYPVVLAHGFFGFDDFAGAGFLTYYYGVRDDLAAHGEPLVFTPTVDPFNDSATRGAQLVAAIEAILAETGHAKVNLVGHSQGGLDARVAAFDRPDLVASVTTIATPHRGTGIADVVLGIVSDDRARSLVDAVVRIIGAPIWDSVGDETSVVAALEQLSSAGMADFNLRYPDRIDLPYFSIAGRTDLHSGRPACDVADAPPFITRWDGYRDPVDLLLDLSEVILDGGLTDPFPNDGLVRVVDARWGRFLGCVPADHLDEVGQLLGDRPGLGNPFDYLAFYRELISWLREQGL